MNMILDSTKILESVARQESSEVPNLDHIIPPKEKPLSKGLPPSRLDEKTTSKRKLLERSASKRGLEKSASKRGLLDRSISKKAQPEKPSSPRGLSVAKNAAARFQASKQVYPVQAPATVPVTTSAPAPASACPPTRGVPRTKSLDNAPDDLGRQSRRAPPRRHKSTDGSLPPTRRATMTEQRSCSVRRMPSRRSLQERSHSERRFETNHSEPNCVRIPNRLDNSSDDGTRSSRRRRPGNLDDSSSRRRLPGRSLSNGSGCSQNTTGSCVRRRRRTLRETSMRNVPDFDRMDVSGEQQSAEEEVQAEEEEQEEEEEVVGFEADFSEFSKEMEDESRPRKETNLSRLSINELRYRLQGTAPGADESNHNSDNEDSIWDNDVAPPAADWFTAVATAVTTENFYNNLNDDDDDDGYY